MYTEGARVLAAAADAAAAVLFSVVVAVNGAEAPTRELPLDNKDKRGWWPHHTHLTIQGAVRSSISLSKHSHHRVHHLEGALGGLASATPLPKSGDTQQRENIAGAVVGEDATNGNPEMESNQKPERTVWLLSQPFSPRPIGLQPCLYFALEASLPHGSTAGVRHSNLASGRRQALTD